MTCPPAHGRRRRTKHFTGNHRYATNLSTMTPCRRGLRAKQLFLRWTQPKKKWPPMRSGRKGWLDRLFFPGRGQEERKQKKKQRKSINIDCIRCRWFRISFLSPPPESDPVVQVRGGAGRKESESQRERVGSPRGEGRRREGAMDGRIGMGR
jgi:hypothetical protein